MAPSRDDVRTNLLADLDGVREEILGQFEDGPRRQQFERHLATTRMCVEHLFDEADRASDQ